MNQGLENMLNGLQGMIDIAFSHPDHEETWAVLQEIYFICAFYNPHPCAREEQGKFVTDSNARAAFLMYLDTKTNEGKQLQTILEKAKEIHGETRIPDLVAEIWNIELMQVMNHRTDSTQKDLLNAYCPRTRYEQQYMQQHHPDVSKKEVSREEQYALRKEYISHLQDQMKKD